MSRDRSGSGYSKRSRRNLIEEEAEEVKAEQAEEKRAAYERRKANKSK